MGQTTYCTYTLAHYSINTLYNQQYHLLGTDEFLNIFSIDFVMNLSVHLVHQAP